jgi:hypothetical protein
MSTKSMILFVAGVALAGGLAGCAGSPPDDSAPHSFSQLRIGRPKPAPEEQAVPAAPIKEASNAAPANAPVPAPTPVPGASRAEAPAPAAVASVAAAPVEAGAVDPAAAAHRVDAYLAAEGFSAEDSEQNGARVVVATRMAEPRRLEHEATCSLEAMRRPDFSAANLTVRLAPGANGLAVGVESSFVEVNTNLISGTLVRQACKSRGVLETGVRRAALGG